LTKNWGVKNEKNAVQQLRIYENKPTKKRKKKNGGGGKRRGKGGQPRAMLDKNGDPPTGCGGFKTLQLQNENRPEKTGSKKRRKSVGFKKTRQGGTSG